MKERFKQETEGLVKSWMKHDRKTLRDYLVQGVEDPRINVQSILSRHFLIRALFGKRFADLMEHELRFALVVNWVLKLLKQSTNAYQLHTVLDALLAKRNKAEGLQIPRYVSQTFAILALPNYICDLLSAATVEMSDATIPDYLLVTFRNIWVELLTNEQPPRISVLEPACGSANDYRFIDAFGIARFLNYTGLDLCEKNIRNAKQMFPEVRFKAGNVLEIDAPDNAFDYCFMSDLFEHLSIEAMEAAAAQLCRVARQGLCVSFFNMYDGKQHIVKPVGDYHWNKLSMPETKAVFKRYASKVQVIHIDTFLKSKFGCGDTHNKNAYTFIVKKQR
jgi:ubiquinone/menaquinone biosynthesis C-methylase UbiE